jgi:TRAP-type C4-dicarboxylate transport system permease small subunit
VSEPIEEDVFAPSDPLGRVVFLVCRGVALAGGLVLVAVAAMSAASVCSRWLFDRSLMGDFELVQLGCAIAVSTFLPYCQMRRGHVIVDFFTVNLERRNRAWLDAFGAVLLAACAALIAWRMGLGLISARASGESSMLLGVPIWLAYVPIVPSFALLAIAGCYTAWADFKRQRQ